MMWISSPSSTSTNRPSKQALLLSLLVLMESSSRSSAQYMSCSDPCNGGDVNYDLRASVRTVKLMDYVYKGRMYSSGDADVDDDEDASFMGPTMRVKPGQSLWIKLRNEMNDKSFGPHAPNATDYWKMLQSPGENIKYQFYKASVKSPSLMQVDHPNIPKNWDNTNLHLHGLDIEVHMFDPVGTHDPAAPHIVIPPGDCYCYQFNVPEHHPAGMYWYHPHLHGSTALQLWSGMLGLLYVEGPIEEELRAYGVTRTEEFVIWDPVFRAVEGKSTHNIEVDEFLLGQTTLSKIHPFLVNGKLTPNYDDLGVGQVLHLRSLCATIENENTFIVYRQGEEDLNWDEAAIPFWVIGSDGVTHRTPTEHNILVMAGAQRQEILLQFDEPGTYVISQQGIEGMQFFDMRGHPHNQILANITVVENNNVLPTIPISEMRFTPGYDESEAIQAEDIVKTETIVFSMGANRNQAPFPQYYVNGKAFDSNRLDFFAHPGEAREYILINAQHNVHPFHIHVNRFQVKEMGSELSTETYPVLKAVLDFDRNAWRDTVIVPPNGRTRIWVQYKNYTGKTVFHCHFLAHEDTGMMATLFIGQPDFPPFVVQLLHDHWQLLVGAGIGILGSVLLLLVYYSAGSRRGHGAYELAEMNDLKSKVVD